MAPELLAAGLIGAGVLIGLIADHWDARVARARYDLEHPKDDAR